jgi:hypothetical protein
MKACSFALSDGSVSRECSIRAPRPMPFRRSLRYSAAHCARPASTAASNVKTRLLTPPVEVMTTTIATCGWSSSTSTWRIVEVSSGGAETIASRFVTCDSVSVVARIASSTSRRMSCRSSARSRWTRSRPPSRRST